KDRRTFVLLLMTDLRSYEIVLGKLFGSLLRILLLLAGMVPVLAILLLLGGIAPSQVLQVAIIMAATAFAVGSLGSLVALWREKTFPTLALTVLFLVLYLLLVQALGFVPDALRKLGSDRLLAALGDVILWQTWLNPFLVLGSVFNPL